MRRMHLIGRIEPQRLRQVGHPLGPHIHPRHRIARHRQPDHIRNRPAAGQRAAGTVRKAHHGFQPAHHLPVGRRRRRIAAAQIRPLNRGDEITQGPGEIAAAHIPAEKPRMDGAHRIAQQVVLHLGINIGQRRRNLRNLRQVGCAHILRHRLPDRAAAHALQMVHRVIHDPVRHRPGRRPVVGVKTDFRWVLHVWLQFVRHRQERTALTGNRPSIESSASERLVCPANARAD